MPQTPASARQARARGHAPGSTALGCDERRALQQGRLFRELPPELQDAIIGRAYVWRLKDGEQVLPAMGTPEHWLGVASGELLGRTRSPESGQFVATHVLSPGAWLNAYSPLSGLARRGIDFYAGGPTCLVALSRADMQDLIERWPALMAAILSLSSLNLRFAQLLLQETQSHTLDQKLLRWIDTAFRYESNRGGGAGLSYRSTVPQAALAASSGVSRQSWNAAMARLAAAGVIERIKDGLRVTDPARLEAAMRQHGLQDTARHLQGGPQPVLPPRRLPAEALPIASLRDDEREVLDTLRWCQRLDAPLREALLAQMQVLRLPDQAALACASCQPPGWVALVRGGLRLISPPPPPCSKGQGPLPAAPRRSPPRPILNRLAPGATYFEYALLDHGHCGVDVRSEGETTLLLLAPDAFRSAVATLPEFALGVLKWLSLSHHHIGRLKFILTLPMPLRLKAWLDVLIQHRGQPEGDWLSVPMDLGQQEIAAWLSTTRQYVAKALNQLEAEGLLQRRRDAFLLRREALPLAKAKIADADC